MTRLYITVDDDSLDILRTYHNYSAAILEALSKLGTRDRSMDEVFSELGKTQFDVCETHHGYYKGCWKNHG